MTVLSELSLGPVERIWEGVNLLGEGPMWHVAEQVLYWIDIRNKSLHRLNPHTGDYTDWPLPDYVGGVVIRKKGGLLATVGNEIVIISLPSGKLTSVCAVSPWHEGLRMNEVKCDRAGRFWFGVTNTDLEDPKGALYCLDLDGTLHLVRSQLTITNGFGWSPDNKIFYYSDGLKYRVYQCDFDIHTGKISQQRVWLQLPKSDIEPDGLTVDSEGCIWEAQWNSGKVFRYSPAGTLLGSIDFPVARPTSCIFGGAHLNTLFVTSASLGLEEHTALPFPAGSLFAIKVRTTGLPEPAFAG